MLQTRSVSVLLFRDSLIGSGFLPVPFIPALGATATFAWAAFALLLLIDAWPRNTALATAVLLLLFALAMSFGLRNQSAFTILRLRWGNRSLLLRCTIS